MSENALAKAYVQIIPSAKGISGSISKALGGEASNAGHQAGESFASKLVGNAKKLIAAAGIGAALKQSISEGADLQQSLGGIETLFKDSADTVKAYAAQAYKNAGVSANTYMETVTSFSASLLQSLGGDTAKAAEAANQAMVDMSDNANKMGTDMQSIQMAYQGFAKQNYTMLDNLKLGYGGTKSEMERLLADAQKLTGVKYDISNLADVYEAIHVVQTELGITGTTAEEASTTFTGSFGAMKAAASDLLGNLAIGEDIGPALDALLETTSTFLLDNLIPMVWNILQQLPGLVIQAIDGVKEIALTKLSEAMPGVQESGAGVFLALIDGIRASFPEMIAAAGEAIQTMIQKVSGELPKVLESGTLVLNELIAGIIDCIPALLDTGGEVMAQLLKKIMEALPEILSAGVSLIAGLVSGLVQKAPDVFASIGSMIGKMIATFVQNLPEFLKQGTALISSLIAGIVSLVPSIAASAVTLITSFFGAFKDTDWGKLGNDIIDGIVAGIQNGVGAILEAARGAARSALNAAKKALGIASPSKVMRDEVGKFIPAGIAEGISGNQGTITKAMDELADQTASKEIKTKLRMGLSADGETSGSADIRKGKTGFGGVSVSIRIDRFENNSRQDIESLADEIAEEIAFRVQQKEAALA